MATLEYRARGFNLEYKKIGKSGLEVSVVGLGTGFRSGLTKDSAEVIRKALDAGITLIDTAEIYHDGQTEKVVSEVIKSRREDVVVVSKVSRRHLNYGDVLKAAEGSLGRLGVNVIDLYLVHWPNPNVPLRETMRAMEKLVKDGKVRYIGVSNFNVLHIKEAQESLSRCELVANEVKYNIIERGIEDEVLPYCRRENIGIIAYSPLARGLLTGKFDSETEIPAEHWRCRDNLFQGERFMKSLQLVAKLREIGAFHGKTPNQIALNWLVTKPAVVAIFGASNTEQVQENCGSVGWKLTSEELGMIKRASKDLGLH